MKTSGGGTRRDFLKLSAAGSVGLLLPYCLAPLARSVLPAICYWVPRVTPLSISLLQAPLPTTFLLLGRAQQAVFSKIAARKFSGRF